MLWKLNYLVMILKRFSFSFSLPKYRSDDVCVDSEAVTV